MTIKFRPARIEDARRLRKWRNDPETRANSLNTEEVAWPEHITWLRASLGTLLIAERGREAVGTVRIDGNELSWTVAPKHRGKGVGKQMVALAAPLATIARIKPANIASQRIAENAGFRLAVDGDPQVWRRAG